METLPLFPLEEFEQEAAQVQEYEAEEGSGGVEELAVGRPPAGTREAGECVDLQGVTGNQEDGPTRTEGVLPEPAERQVYESTSLGGPFPLGALARVFPDCGEEVLDSLANDIAVNGLLEEITVAGTPPQVVDGKHRLRACQRAGVSPTFRRLREGLETVDRLVDFRCLQLFCVNFPVPQGLIFCCSRLNARSDIMYPCRRLESRSVSRARPRPGSGDSPMRTGFTPLRNLSPRRAFPRYRPMPNSTAAFSASFLAVTALVFPSLLSRVSIF